MKSHPNLPQKNKAKKRDQRRTKKRFLSKTLLLTFHVCLWAPKLEKARDEMNCYLSKPERNISISQKVDSRESKILLNSYKLNLSASNLIYNKTLKIKTFCRISEFSKKNTLSSTSAKKRSEILENQCCCTFFKPFWQNVADHCSKRQDTKH